LESVSDHGGEFIPLVCESFGAWTPFALSTLFIIADWTTIKSGVSRRLARKQLIQHLPVTVWKYNAKMILRPSALYPEVGLSVD